MGRHDKSQSTICSGAQPAASASWTLTAVLIQEALAVTHTHWSRHTNQHTGTQSTLVSSGAVSASARGNNEKLCCVCSPKARKQPSICLPGSHSPGESAFQSKHTHTHTLKIEWPALCVPLKLVHDQQCSFSFSTSNWQADRQTGGRRSSNEQQFCCCFCNWTMAN